VLLGVIIGSRFTLTQTQKLTKDKGICYIPLTVRYPK
jgi:hypothetical protein